MDSNTQVISGEENHELPAVVDVDKGEHDDIANKSLQEVEAWDELEESIVAESVDASLTVKEVQDLRDQLTLAHANLAWRDFEETMDAESPKTSLTVQEVQDLQEDLAKAQAIIAKVTELAEFWTGDPQHAYNAGQMKYALGITAPDWIHPSLAAAYNQTI